MAAEILEGTWEEMLEHAAELEGRRVRVMVLGDDECARRRPRLRKENREMLALLDEWQKTPLTPEERRALDEFEEFRKEHPLRVPRMAGNPNAGMV
jgi:hypothetical protein